MNLAERLRAHAEGVAWQDRGDIREDLLNAASRLDTLERERLEWYHADGSIEVLESAEQVRRRRVAAAEMLLHYECELERIRRVFDQAVATAAEMLGDDLRDLVEQLMRNDFAAGVAFAMGCAAGKAIRSASNHSRGEY